MLYVNSRRVIPAERDRLFEFLSDLENHWLLADGAISVVHVEPGDGGRVRMRGPLGVRRTAVTSLERLDPPRAITGTADVGARTRAHVIWELEPDGGGGTSVTLSARVEEAAPLDRLLLAAGGRAWLESRFHRILATLAERFEQ
ncbi:MAG TPA: SRPBCC family protein [Thermoleophilaceae bacterium]